MKRLKSFFRNNTILAIVLVFLSITVAMAFGKILTNNTNNSPVVAGPVEIPELKRQVVPIDDDLSKAVLSVRDMSCSGCIANIKSSLAGFSGISDILVDVRRGRTEIYFDENVLEDVSALAKAITEAGYPAEVEKVITPGELKKTRARATEKSKYYIASVGGWDIARNDFDLEFEIAKAKYAKLYGENLYTTTKGKALLAKLQSQIVSKLLDEGVIMQEIQKTDFKVDEGTVAVEYQEFLDKMGKSQAEFEMALDEIGYDFDYFMKKFETKVLINQYVENRILADASNPADRKNVFGAWFQNTKALAEVVYYDKELETLIRNQSASSGCGSSCGGS